MDKTNHADLSCVTHFVLFFVLVVFNLKFHILTRFTAQVWDFASRNLHIYTVKLYDFQYDGIK